MTKKRRLRNIINKLGISRRGFPKATGVLGAAYWLGPRLIIGGKPYAQIPGGTLPPGDVKKFVLLFGAALLQTSVVLAQPVPGGSLDPTMIPKYVTPLVIPPVMKDVDGDNSTNDYDLAVRQFQQQILPGGIWATLPGCAGQNCTFPPTTVWSYGPDADPTPAIAPDPESQFNYPAYTVENTTDTTTTVDWMNELVRDPDRCKIAANSAACKFIPHLFAIDRSLHWANPEQLPCKDETKTKDCRPDPGNGRILQRPYRGPVPIVTHVHGAHVGPESDGYPEAWWLPNANNIPADYAKVGTLANQYGYDDNTANGVGSYSYPNTQPSTTLWYHDHTLGMTRNNVYAGPAGFWLIRESGGGETGLISGTLPGPAPTPGQGVLDLNVPGDPVRASIREIPIVIQARSFNKDGSLFYPDNRAFFEGLTPSQLKIPFIGNVNPNQPSDISAIWNPETFFNVMVVNGVSWPTLEVEPDLYRFRLLNGCNSRFLNLSMFVVNDDGTLGAEVPFYQIGAEQSLLPKVVQISTGYKTELPGNGTIPASTRAAAAAEALLMGLAERADVLVDFSGLDSGTRVRMINTAPDAPFGGFPDVPADPDTTGQVMEFAVVTDTVTGEGFTAPENLVLSLPDPGDPANTNDVQDTVRDLALLEEESVRVCVTVRPNGKIVYDRNAVPREGEPEVCISSKDPDQIADSVPFAPKAAVLGTNGAGGGTVTLWSSPLVTNPAINATETWELWNWTEDAHPIHLHLVKFKVVNRQPFDEDGEPQAGELHAPEPTEAGWKDTVIAYPGEVTRLNATFDIEGLYVWHCHIVEHEDNEMMVPYCVGDKATAPGCNVVP
jgi:spore coat protein A